MNITNIEIENFRTYKHAHIPVAPGVNVFVGANSAGKSTVLKALAWVWYNTPAGTEMLRAKAPFARVLLTLEDGTQVERLRGKRGKTTYNRYSLRLPDTDWVHFDGFGGEVPEPVKAVLGVTYFVEPGETSPAQYNRMQQGDAPFLLTRPAGQAGRILNAFVGTDAMDTAAKNLRSEARGLAADIARVEEDDAEDAKRLAKLDYLGVAEVYQAQLEECLTDAVDAEQDMGRLVQQAARLTQAVERGEVAQRWLKKGRPLLGDGQRVLAVLQKDVDRLQTLEEAQEELTGICAEAQAAEQEAQALQEVLAQTCIAELCRAQEDYQKLKTVVDQMDTLNDRLRQLADDGVAAKMRLETAQAQYKAMLVELGVCPVCHQGVTDETLVWEA